MCGPALSVKCAAWTWLLKIEKYRVFSMYERITGGNARHATRPCLDHSRFSDFNVLRGRLVREIIGERKLKRVGQR